MVIKSTLSVTYFKFFSGWLYPSGNLILIEFRDRKRRSDLDARKEDHQVTIKNDNIALENDTILRYSLVNPPGTKLAEPSTVDLVITDDDSLLMHSMLFLFLFT